jgi:putative intracellular protease/amidase
MPRTYAAVVLTAVERCPDNRMAGYWLPEAAYPWLALADGGLNVVSISTESAIPVAAGVDRSDPVQRRFLDDHGIRRQLTQTRCADFYQPDDFVAIVYCGGVGGLLDIPRCTELATFTADLAIGGGVVAACGYGAVGLINVVLPRGGHLIEGRKLTTASPAEERILELDALLPFSVADELAVRGADMSFGDPFKSYVVEDGLLVTGQNAASAPELARIVSARAGLSSGGASEGP